MTKNTRSLRRQPTDIENLLWKALRRQQLNGLSFRRQHPVRRYVLDFYCPAVSLAIEVDGGQHAHDANQRYDRERDEWLLAQGIKMLRFWNNDVFSNMRGVLETIMQHVEQTPTPSPREDCADLPLSGGGEANRSP